MTTVVQFPGLWGLHFTISRVAFTVFGVNIYWYGIIIAAGFLLAVLLGMKNSRKFGIDPENIIDLVLFGAIAAIVCARLYYVIFSWDMYKNNLLDIFNTRKGGLAIYGAVIGALVTAYIFTRVRKLNFYQIADFCMPYLVLAQAIGRWGNFVNQEAYGVNTTLPWGMTSGKIQGDPASTGFNPALPVHPTFLYESLWDLAVFIFLIWFRKRKKNNGEVFFLYMALYGVGRAIIEGLRTDSLYLGSMRISQVLAIVFALVFGVLFFYRRNKMAEAQVADVEIGSSEFGGVLGRLKEEGQESGAPAGEIPAQEENPDGKEPSETGRGEGGTPPEDNGPDKDAGDEK